MGEVGSGGSPRWGPSRTPRAAKNRRFASGRGGSTPIAECRLGVSDTEGRRGGEPAGMSAGEDRLWRISIFAEEFMLMFTVQDGGPFDRGTRSPRTPP